MCAPCDLEAVIDEIGESIDFKLDPSSAVESFTAVVERKASSDVRGNRRTASREILVWWPERDERPSEVRPGSSQVKVSRRPGSDPEWFTVTDCPETFANTIGVSLR